MADLNVAVKVSADTVASGPLNQVAASLDAIQIAADRAGAGTAGFTVQVLKASEASTAAAAANEKMGSGLGNLGQMIAGFAIGGVLFGAISSIPQKITSVITSMTDLGQATFHLQALVGGSMESTSALLAVFERYGVTTDQATISLDIFSRHLAGFADTTSGAMPLAKSFRQSMDELGVAFTDVNGQVLPMNQVLLNVADKFAAMGPGVDRTAIAMQLFGRSGANMVPVLSLGAAGMQEAEAAAAKYGLTLTGANVQAIRDYGFAQKDLAEASTGLSLQIGEMLLPSLSALATGLATDAQTMNQTIIPALKNYSTQSNQSASDTDLLTLALEKMHQVQAGAGSNASNDPAMNAAADQTVTNMRNAGNAALDYANALGMLFTVQGRNELATRALGAAMDTAAPQAQHLGDTMAAVAADNSGVGQSAVTVTPQFAHLGDTMAAVASDANELTQKLIADHSALMAFDAQVAVMRASAAAAMASDPNAGRPLFTTDPSSSAAAALQNQKDLQAELARSTAAATKTGSALASVGTSAIASLPGLSALDMAIAGTSAKLAAVQLVIEEKVFARMSARPINTPYQAEAYLQEQLKIENLQKAAGYNVGTEAIKISNADIRAGKHPGGFTPPASAQGGAVTLQFNPGSVVINGASADQAGTDFAAFLKTLNTGGTGAGPATTSLSGIRN